MALWLSVLVSMYPLLGTLSLLCHVRPFHFMSCHVMSRHVMSCTCDTSMSYPYLDMITFDRGMFRDNTSGKSVLKADKTSLRVPTINDLGPKVDVLESKNRCFGIQNDEE